MLSWFKASPVVQEEAEDNLFSLFEWALSHFDRKRFFENTVLVLPNSASFPDKANNEVEMAMAIYRRVLGYAGLSHWPFVLVSQENFQPTQPPVLGLNYQDRSSMEGANTLASRSTPLMLSYSPVMMKKKPMDLVASMSNLVAQHYLIQSQQVPPTGPETFNAAAEVISIFMGFGVFEVNSAYTFRGSCASCYDPRATRSAALSESEAVFGLAIYLSLKKQPVSEALPHLKSHLRPLLKKAMKQVQSNSDRLLPLMD